MLSIIENNTSLAKDISLGAFDGDNFKKFADDNGLVVKDYKISSLKQNDIFNEGLVKQIFLTKDGDVLVNEIAPRPHNSGHQTIEGNYESQYGQLLRCLLNLPLGNTAIKRPSVMVNLLGEKGYMGKAIYDGIEKALAHPGVNLHLYGKAQTKPFRKMGHVTIMDDSIEKAKTKANFVKNNLTVISNEK